MDLKESSLLGEGAARHWYYRSKAAAMTRFLRGMHPARVLDVGAGSGFFTRYLLERDLVSSGVCVDPGYDVDRDETCAGKALGFRRSIGADDADLVLFMDVLEHVDDDTGLLASYTAKVPVHARFLLTVPAHQWLWSEHDVFLEHRRRYTLGEIERVASRAGLRVENSSYFFAFVLPIAAAMRIASRLARPVIAPPKSQLVRHGPLTDLLLGGLCRAELPFLFSNRLAGLSAFCLASKAG